MITLGKIWKICFLIYLAHVSKVIGAEICYYYVNYPETSFNLTTMCFEKCCAGYATKLSDACCNINSSTTSSRLWLIFCFGVGFFCTLSVFKAIFELKYKNRNRISQNRSLNMSLISTISDQSSYRSPEINAIYARTNNSNNYLKPTTINTSSIGKSVNGKYDASDLFELPTYDQLFVSKTRANPDSFSHEPPPIVLNLGNNNSNNSNNQSEIPVSL